MATNLENVRKLSAITDNRPISLASSAMPYFTVNEGYTRVASPKKTLSQRKTSITHLMRLLTIKRSDTGLSYNSKMSSPTGLEYATTEENSPNLRVFSPKILV
jgi:hypothetical protein